MYSTINACVRKYFLFFYHVNKLLCRDTFIRPMSEAMKMGTYEEVVIDAPYTYLNKGDIGRIGAQLGIDYGRDSWSCYKGGDVHCGKCGACTERKEALAGFDTTVYES